MQPLLRELLDLGLVDVGDNDAWYDFLEKASEKLAQHFRKNPAKAIPAILVALDDDAGQDEPSFQHAEDVLREDWKGLRSRFKERPRPLLRILLFDALKRAADQSPRLASTLWLSTSYLYPHLRHGRENAPFTRELTAYAEQLEQEVRQLGGEDHTIKSPNLSPAKLPPSLKVDGKVIKDNDFIALLFAAVGPQDPQNQYSGIQFANSHWLNTNNSSGTGPNPHWTNGHQSWCWAFAPRMNEILTSAINTGSQRLADQVTQFATQLSISLQHTLDQQAKQLTSSADQLLQQSNERGEVARLKTDVLWWLEALYSPSLRTSYRNLPPSMAVVAMSHDLFDIVDACLPTPASVAHVLGEAVNRLNETGYDRRYSLLDTLAKVQEHGPQLREIVSAPTEAVGRRPLLQVVETSVYQAAPSERDLLAQTGLRGDETVSMPELAMWCFQDLQARSLCEEEG